MAKSKADRNHHANQGNPNNSAQKAARENKANQGNPNNRAHPNRRNNSQRKSGNQANQ